MPKIKGQALYLELVPDTDNLTEAEVRRVCGWQGEKAVQQVIIFPRSVDDTGREQLPVVLTRTISPTSPRAQWDWQHFSRGSNYKVKSIDADPDSTYATIETYSREEWDLLPEATKTDSYKLVMQTILKNLVCFTDYEYDEKGDYVRDSDNRVVRTTKQGWVVRGGKPISIETTDEDYEDLHHKSKTPQAVIRRINKVRESLADFPTKLV